MKSKEHTWTGWPGAFCLKCGVPDLWEVAIGEGDYDPYLHKWRDDETRRTCETLLEKYRYCDGGEE